MRASKKLYFNSNLEKNIKNPKKTWDLLKEAANLQTTKVNIDKISSDNITLTDPKSIADKFNDFFVKIGPEISDSVNPSLHKPEDFVPNLEGIHQLEFSDISPTLICDIIKYLESKSSTDSDGISSKLLKRVSNEICIPIAHIFNLSVNQGIFPEKLKKSRVVPIFKQGNAEICDNYRPISLCSQLSKILEKIISVQLTNYLDINNILYKHQYGFQRNKSTEQNLVHAFNFIGNALNNNEFCIGVFFDLKKAFDVCSYDILIMKLQRIGINGVALKWFQSYLQNRMQFVDIDGNFSSDKKIKTCILQGSILGPILFLIYINDLFTVSKTLTLMFADDTFSLKAGTNLNILIDELNVDINKMAIWFKANKLAVNKNKTKYMIFHIKGKKLPAFSPIVYDENETNMPFNPDLVCPLERCHDKHQNKECRAYKLLGIFLDEHLSLDFHVKHLASKLNKSLYCIRAAKNNLNAKGLRSLYFALIHSHLNILSYNSQLLKYIKSKYSK